jgi:TRAP-type mannitol/chloroaromatic compound transport system substrate-binding protein
MKRRDFVRKAVVGAVGAAGASALGACGGGEGSGPAVITQPQVNWRLASSFPRGLDTIYGAAEVLGQRLEAMSDGRFRVRAYPAGELVPGLQVLDAVQQGTVQVGHTAGYYYTGKNPALPFDTCIPFGMTSRQQTAWLSEGGGLELTRQLYADFNIINFLAGNTGAQMGGWFKREIGSAADLKGLKMRIPGLGGEVMNRLGVNVQLLAGGEIYPALERGVIDATEWVGPYDDEKLGFHQVAKNYYYPGWWEPGPSLSYLVNRDAWDKLPSAYQAMFEAAASESATVMQARYDAQNPAALQRLLAEGITLRRFSDDILEAAQAATFEMLEEEAAKDATYRNLFDAWKKAREEQFRWFGTAELAYAEFSFR